MVERGKRSKWFWLLLLLFPVGWWWGRDFGPDVREEESLEGATSAAASTTTDESHPAKRPSQSPPRLALPEKPFLSPPSLNQEIAAPPAPAPSLTKTEPLPVDLSDAEIAAFSPETIKMLNTHKYWTPNGLVDGLYDAWVNKKQQGVDVEDVRKQIGWALQGMFMENY